MTQIGGFVEIDITTVGGNIAKEMDITSGMRICTEIDIQLARFSRHGNTSTLPQYDVLARLKGEFGRSGCFTRFGDIRINPNIVIRPE